MTTKKRAPASKATKEHWNHVKDALRPGHFPPGVVEDIKPFRQPPGSLEMASMTPGQQRAAVFKGVTSHFTPSVKDSPVEVEGTVRERHNPNVRRSLIPPATPPTDNTFTLHLGGHAYSCQWRPSNVPDAPVHAHVIGQEEALSVLAENIDAARESLAQAILAHRGLGGYGPR